jgi:hypothetical protein
MRFCLEEVRDGKSDVRRADGFTVFPSLSIFDAVAPTQHGGSQRDDLTRCSA